MSVIDGNEMSPEQWAMGSLIILAQNMTSQLLKTMSRPKTKPYMSSASATYI